MKLVIRLLITAGSAYFLKEILKGVEFDSFWAAIVFAIILGILNAIVTPILKILSFPITLLTLGLFSLIINALITLLADHFVEGMQIDGFLPALIFSILLSIITSVLNAVFTDKN
ncbi:MAG: phage holin family protein [Bergeyella zoohelcum]|nr:phage holin family protein [Bergeyella zoohelcum]